MEKEWQPAFAQMTYGIYVLTVRDKDDINGMIASWVTQVSYDPPLILTAVHPSRYSCRLIEDAQAFALHVIDRSRKDLLARFKGPDPVKKFDGIDTRTMKTGAPVLNDCLAWFELSVKERYRPGNHVLFTCEVINAGVKNQGTPLCTLDYDGVYTGRGLISNRMTRYYR